MRSGIPYFPLDVALNDSMKLIEAEFGLTGFAVVVKLFQKIYGERGYYCEMTNEVALLFSHSIRLGGKVVSEIITASIKRGIFDQTLYEKYNILTSQGIQKRYFEAVSRRKNVEVKGAYLLLSAIKIPDNVDIIAENVNIYKENVYISEQRRVKERRVKKSGGTHTLYKPPSLSDIDTYCKEKGLSVDAERFYNYYSAGDWTDSNGTKVKNWKQKIITWDNHDKKKQGNNSSTVTTKSASEITTGLTTIALEDIV